MNSSRYTHEKGKMFSFQAYSVILGGKEKTNSLRFSNYCFIDSNIHKLLRKNEILSSTLHCWRG